ncbi:hypothetical protein [Lacinutrix chionoecetis]
MKKFTLIIGALAIVFSIFYLGYKAILAGTYSEPEAGACKIQTEKIIKISEGISKDIVLKDANGDKYYINRGLQRGLNLESLRSKVLNKTVTLHLPKLLGGRISSENIAQIAVGNNIIFTEFRPGGVALNE